MTVVSGPNGRPDCPARTNPPVNSVHNDFAKNEHFTRTRPVPRTAPWRTTTTPAKHPPDRVQRPARAPPPTNSIRHARACLNRRIPPGHTTHRPAANPSPPHKERPPPIPDPAAGRAGQRQTQLRSTTSSPATNPALPHDKRTLPILSPTAGRARRRQARRRSTTSSPATNPALPHNERPPDSPTPPQDDHASDQPDSAARRAARRRTSPHSTTAGRPVNLPIARSPPAP